MARSSFPLTRTQLAATALTRRRLVARRVVAGALATLNLCGLAGYLWLAAHLWLRPEEVAAGITPQSGDFLIRNLTTLPLWAFFVVLDTCWVIYELAPPPRWRKAGLVAAMLALWIVALLIDSTHY